MLQLDTSWLVFLMFTKFPRVGVHPAAGGLFSVDILIRRRICNWPNLILTKCGFLAKSKSILRKLMINEKI